MGVECHDRAVGQRVGGVPGHCTSPGTTKGKAWSGTSADMGAWDAATGKLLLREEDAGKFFQQGGRFVKKDVAGAAFSARARAAWR